MSGPLTLGYQLVFLNTTIHPLAVCNDGSPAAYYIHRGDPSRWVLHQQGGWWCWDDYSCLVRWKHFSNHSTELRTLMSTSALAELTKQHDTFNGEKNTGIMAHNGTVNPVANASKVFLVYCSSDSHAGNRTAHSEFAPSGAWHFRGKEIVRAVLEDLSAREQLQRATQVLLTGGSAGGMATLNNADWVGAYVRTVAPAARFVAMPDSGYFLDVMPGAMCQLPDRYECRCAQPPAAGGGAAAAAGHGWLGPGQTLAQQAQNMIGYTGGLPDASCADHHGRWGSWRCYLGQYAAPHIVTPTLLLQSQIDEWQGFWNGFFAYASEAHAYEYAAWFRTTSLGSLQDAAVSSDSLSVFAPNCYHHGLSYDARFWEVKAGGSSAATMLAGLLAGEEPRVSLDSCEGLPCSPATKGYSECEPVTPPVSARP